MLAFPDAGLGLPPGLATRARRGGTWGLDAGGAFRRRHRFTWNIAPGIMDGAVRARTAYEVMGSLPGIAIGEPRCAAARTQSRKNRSELLFSFACGRPSHPSRPGVFRRPGPARASP